MTDNTLNSIFKKGSTTYFYSSIFFPEKIKKDVFSLYGFVRTADDLVDSVPQQHRAFRELVENYGRAKDGERTGILYIDSFVDLERRLGFDPEWTYAFLRSMEMDLSGRTYQTSSEVDSYMYGSAEVIGLFMAKILRLPLESYHYARLLGKAMQYTNFIRDIDEDWGMRRTYFPKEDFDEFGLSSLSREHTESNPEAFRAFMRKKISQFRELQSEAEKGFKYIPHRLLIPIKTASEMYKWTASGIYRDPFIVYRRKVKPSISRIVLEAGRNTLFPGVSR